MELVMMVEVEGLMHYWGTVKNVSKYLYFEGENKNF
jgi:hypothetical protein